MNAERDISDWPEPCGLSSQGDVPRSLRIKARKCNYPPHKLVFVIIYGIDDLV